jgi:hypothetical protein
LLGITPRKTGWGVPGTGHRIDEPLVLSGSGPATVLLANPAYRGEVSARLEDLGVISDLVALWGDGRCRGVAIPRGQAEMSASPRVVQR